MTSFSSNEFTSDNTRPPSELRSFGTSEDDVKSQAMRNISRFSLQTYIIERISEICEDLLVSSRHFKV